MFLYIVRHGEPDYTTDTLVPNGVKQAQAVAERLFKAGIDRVFTSPLGRARQTAEPLCRLLNKEYTVEDWTREIAVMIDLPDGAREPLIKVQNTRFREKDVQVSISADTKDAFARIEKEGNAFLERLGYRYEDGNYRILQPNEEKVVLFCHGNFARVWLSSLLKMPLTTMLSSFGYGFTGVSVLCFKNNEDGLTAPWCFVYSDTSHLDTGEFDTNYNGKFKL